MTDQPSTPNEHPEAADDAEQGAGGGQSSGKTAEGTGAPDPKEEEPSPARAEDDFGQEERVRDALRRGKRSPRAILTECLYRAFHNEEAVRSFCFEHFEQVYKELKETDRIAFIVRSLIGYCESHGRVIDLWDALARVNKAQHEEWFPHWREAQEKYKDSRESEYAEFRASSTSSRPASEPTPTEHPLSSGSPETVSDWFFNDLDARERGTVLATALFQGMNRTYLVDVAQALAKLLDPAADEPEKHGSGSQ